ncbi:MAG: adenylate kinase [Candidatus Omnitrophica bacterium]|nr:adenylate kinase [Candidatus Omnitrophota bacterium]
MKIVLLGPPGAGKGTQGVVLSRNYKVPHISTGDILREAVKGGTLLGKKAKAFMDSGELVPDEVVTGIVVERLAQKDTKSDFILDGFPRTLKQALDLDTELNKMSSGIDMVLYFDIPEEAAIERLTGRRVCKKCGANYHVKNIPPKVGGVCDKCGAGLFQRPDDSIETVKNRLKVYEAQTSPLIDYYTKKGILKKVSGALDVNDLFKIIAKLLSDAKLA